MTTESGTPAAAVAALMERPITVAGRTFWPVTRSTFEHQLYMMPLVQAAGLRSIGAAASLTAQGDGPEAEVAATQIVLQVIASGYTLELLAGSLVEAGADGQRLPWRRADAAARREFFATLEDPRDIETLQVALVGLLAGFWMGGSASSATSPSSSAPTAAAIPTSAPAEGPSISAVPPSAPPSATAAPATAATPS